MRWPATPGGKAWGGNGPFRRHNQGVVARRPGLVSLRYGDLFRSVWLLSKLLQLRWWSIVVVNLAVCFDVTESTFSITALAAADVYVYCTRAVWCMLRFPQIAGRTTRPNIAVRRHSIEIGSGRCSIVFTLLAVASHACGKARSWSPAEKFPKWQSFFAFMRYHSTDSFYLCHFRFLLSI